MKDSALDSPTPCRPTLDNPTWEALCGPHAPLATRRGQAAVYPPEVSPFAGLAEPGEGALADLASLVEPGGIVGLVCTDWTPAGAAWTTVERLTIIQMVCENLHPPAADSRAATAVDLPTPLATGDVPAMLELATATEPGPFGPRTIEMGRYVGFRQGGRLVAMGGERLKPPGYTEVSAICTAAEARGQGRAEAIVRALVADIHARAESAFLHVRAGSPSERTAVGLYSRLGFRERRRGAVHILRRQ